MFWIKESEMARFYGEIRKRGATVDEKENEIMFCISSKDDEYWRVEKSRNDDLEIRYSTTVCNITDGRKVKTAPTQECKEKIAAALEAIRKS